MKPDSPHSRVDLAAFAGLMQRRLETEPAPRALPAGVPASFPAPPADPSGADRENPQLMIAFGIVGAAARQGVGCGQLTPAMCVALSDWHRRAWQETHTPYQTYWRDRAMAAEKELETRRIGDAEKKD